MAGLSGCQVFVGCFLSARRQAPLPLTKRLNRCQAIIFTSIPPAAPPKPWGFRYPLGRPGRRVPVILEPCCQKFALCLSLRVCLMGFPVCLQLLDLGFVDRDFLLVKIVNLDNAEADDSINNTWRDSEGFCSLGHIIILTGFQRRLLNLCPARFPLRFEALDLVFVDHDFLSAKALGLDHSFADRVDDETSRDAKQLRRLSYGIIFAEFHGHNVVSVDNP